MSAAMLPFLIILLAMSASVWARYPATMLPGQQKGNCSYTVEIETTCAPLAETEDHVSVRFGDSEGNHVIAKHLKYPLKAGQGGEKEKNYNDKPFDKCAIDRFEVGGPCMQRGICYLYLKRVGSDEWRPGWAKVLRQHSDGLLSQASDVFYFRTFLPSNVWFGFDYCDSHHLHLPSVLHADDGDDLHN